MSYDHPDWQLEVWRAAAADRVVLDNREAMHHLHLLADALASTFPHRVPPIAGGGNDWAIDPATGLTTLTCPASHTWSLYRYWWASNATLKGVFYFDGQPVASLFEGAHRSHYEHDIFLDYYELDPTGAVPHPIRANLINQSAHDMECYFAWDIKFIAVGTERAETKEVKCRVCGFMHVVPRRSTLVRCPDCEALTTYYPILHGGEKPIVELVEP